MTEAAGAKTKVAEAQQSMTRSAGLDLPHGDEPLRQVGRCVLLDRVKDDRRCVRCFVSVRHLDTTLGLSGGPFPPTSRNLDAAA